MYAWRGTRVGRFFELVGDSLFVRCGGERDGL